MRIEDRSRLLVRRAGGLALEERRPGASDRLRAGVVLLLGLRLDELLEEHRANRRPWCAGRDRLRRARRARSACGGRSRASRHARTKGRWRGPSRARCPAASSPTRGSRGRCSRRTPFVPTGARRAPPQRVRDRARPSRRGRRDSPSRPRRARRGSRPGSPRERRRRIGGVALGSGSHGAEQRDQLGCGRRALPAEDGRLARRIDDPERRQTRFGKWEMNAALSSRSVSTVSQTKSFASGASEGSVSTNARMLRHE